MAAVPTIAALLVALVAVAAAGDVPDRAQYRRWFHECRKTARISKSKPLWAVKKSIVGLYDPNTHHAFRKTKVTFAKYEFATVRDPSKAEKCFMECLAEKQGMINGSRLDAVTITNVMMSFGKKINIMSRHKRVDMTQLKRNTAKCIVGTHGSTEDCELGYKLFHCLRQALVESMHDITTTAAPMTSTTPAGAPSTEPTYYTTPSAPVAPPPSSLPAPQPAPQRYVAVAAMPPPPPPMGMMPPPPPPAMVPVATAPGLTPSLVAYRQGSGMVQVYGGQSNSWRPNWRRLHDGHRMGPMI